MSLMHFGRKSLLIGAAALSLAGCTQGNQQETIGTLFGAALGGWVGAKIDNDGAGGAAAIAAGTIAGGLIGGSIGRNMDETDRLQHAQAQQRAFETGVSGSGQQWFNPDTGAYGTVTPQTAYQTYQGQYCREFQQVITVGGQQVDGYGTACRQPDGSWKITA